MNWILLALAPVLLGALAGALLAPKNRGKKPLQPQFTVAFSVRTRVCAGATMLAMLLVLAATALWGGDTVSRYAPFYLVYTVFIGLALALLAYMCTYYVEFEGDAILVHRRTGKAQQLRAGELGLLDVHKYEVRVCRAGGEKLFTLGIQMENLDLFFAWTHAHPAIRVAVNGQPLPGGKR